jgi:hypothetical protein
MKAEGMSRELRVAGYELRVTRGERREARGGLRVAPAPGAGNLKPQILNPKPALPTSNLMPTTRGSS